MVNTLEFKPPLQINRYVGAVYRGACALGVISFDTDIREYTFTAFISCGKMNARNLDEIARALHDLDAHR